MITVDVPRAVAWTRVSGRAGEIAWNLSVSMVSAPKTEQAPIPRLGFFHQRRNWDRVKSVEVCDGGPRVWR
jgi:hypothetical protein